MDFDIVLHNIGIPINIDKIWYSGFHKNIFYTGRSSANYQLLRGVASRQ